MEQEEAAICRFCRDEGTEAEPLFYPCKCSGSIKYIHKCCLDEWLKHSQKQECGTCKEKYSYRAVYKPGTPWYAPVIATLREMLAKAKHPICAVARVAFTLVLWFVVIPLVSYWVLVLLLGFTEQFKLWIGPSAGASAAIDGAPWATRGRFSTASSWSEWFAAPQAHLSNDLLWRIGLYGIPHAWLHTFYAYSAALIKPAFSALSRLLWLGLSSSQVDRVFDTGFELLVQAMEGASFALLGHSAKLLANALFAVVWARHDQYNTQAAEINAVQATGEDAEEQRMNAGDGAIDNAGAAQVGGPRLDAVERIIRDGQAAVEDLQRVAADLREIQRRLERLNRRRRVGLEAMLFHGISLHAIRHYLGTVLHIQLAIVLGVWMPFCLGHLLIGTGVASAIDCPLGLYAWLRRSLVQGGWEAVVVSVEWMAILRVLNRIGGLAGIGGYIAVYSVVAAWIEACGMRPAAVQGLSYVLEAIIRGDTGALLAAYLHEVVTDTAGNTPSGIMVAVNVGHVCALWTIWMISGCVLALPGRQRLAKTGWVVHKSINMLMTFMICSLLLPLSSGVLLHMSLAPALSSPPLDTVRLVFGGSMWISMAGYWFAGILVVSFVSSGANLWLMNTRSGFMWYVAKSGSKETSMEHAGLVHSPLVLFTALITNYTFMVRAILSAITVTALFAAATAPTHFPAALSEGGRHFTRWNVLLVPIAAAVLGMIWQHVTDAVGRVFDYISTTAAYALCITEHVTGVRTISDEGRWALKGAPWLRLWLLRPLMPADVVQRAFESMQPISDKARGDDSENALPTSEYYAQVQHAIDRALANTYPYLTFVLEPRNARVPKARNLRIQAGRRAVVLVDDLGHPRDPFHDYETADDPELRKAAAESGRLVPPPASHTDESDLRFKREDYSVVYMPPMGGVREFAYFGLVQVAMGVISLETLLSLWLVGKVVSDSAFGGVSNGVMLICIGLLAAAAAGAALRYLAQAVTRAMRGNDGREEAIRKAVQTLGNAYTVVWQVSVAIAVFGGIITLLACYVVEIYGTVLYMHGSEADTATEPLYGAISVWKRHVDIVTAASAAYFLFGAGPEDWLAHVVIHLARNPGRWSMRRLLLRYALPMAGKLLALCMLPLVLAMLDAGRQGTLSAGAFWDMSLLHDAARLARYSRLAMLAMAVLVVVSKAATLYASTAELVRNRYYAVDRVLVNIDGTQAPTPGQTPAGNGA